MAAMAVRSAYRHTMLWEQYQASLLRNSLTVTLHGEHLATLPVGAHGWLALGSTMSLAAQTTVRTTSRGDATKFAVLVGWGADPVDARVAADSLVRRIDHDDLEVLEGCILVDPV